VFQWQVDLDGYHWVREDETTILSPDLMHKDDQGHWPDCHLEPIRGDFRSYEPLKITGLFRTFADIPLTPAGMLAFANQYGNLGDHLAELAYPIEPPEFESEQEKKEWLVYMHHFVRWFDPINHWHGAIQKVRRCVKLWDNAQRGRAGERTVEEVLSTVNQQLTGDRFQTFFAKDRRKPSGYTMQMVPSNLLAALWLQLGQAITENKRLRSCSACGKWFELAPEHNRKSRYYCTEACRSRAYRDRKEKALRMKKRGKSAHEIADVLNSDVTTVEGWLKQPENSTARRQKGNKG
jgi:hypothetical protein